MSGPTASMCNVLAPENFSGAPTWFPRYDTLYLPMIDPAAHCCEWSAQNELESLRSDAPEWVLELNYLAYGFMYSGESILRWTVSEAKEQLEELRYHNNHHLATIAQTKVEDFANSNLQPHEIRAVFKLMGELMGYDYLAPKAQESVSPPGARQ